MTQVVDIIKVIFWLVTLIVTFMGMMMPAMYLMSIGMFLEACYCWYMHRSGK